MKMSREAIIQLGNNAKYLQENDAYKKVMESIHTEQYANFMATQAGDDKERFQHWCMIQATIELDRKLDVMQENAAIERANIQKEERENG